MIFIVIFYLLSIYIYIYIYIYVYIYILVLLFSNKKALYKDIIINLFIFHFIHIIIKHYNRNK